MFEQLGAKMFIEYGAWDEASDAASKFRILRMFEERERQLICELLRLRGHLAGRNNLWGAPKAQR